MKFPFEKREIAAISALLFLSFIVRLIFFSNQGFEKIDTLDFRIWFQTAADNGPRAFYTVVSWCDYPPLNVYIFWIFGLLAKTLGVLSSNLFTYVMKLPPNLFDLATAFLIFIFIRKRFSFKWAMFATALYSLNPAAIFNAGVWGQFDAIYTFFLVLSLFLIFKSKPKLAIAVFMLGVLTKPQSIALAPLFFFLIWRKTNWKGFLTSILVAAGTVFLVILPFEWSNPVTFLSNLYFGAYGGYPFTTINAFNIWGFQGMWVPDTQFTFILGWLLFATAVVIGLVYVHKRIGAAKESTVLLAALLMFFAFFMLPTRIHERYLFPAIAILVMLFPLMKKMRPIYVALTATCFVNQAYVLSFLNAGTFIQSNDLVVLAVSTVNAIALVYVLALMIKEIKSSWHDKTKEVQQEASPPAFYEVNPSQEQPSTVETGDISAVSKQKFRLPKITKRDIVTIIILCIVFFSIATTNLGYSNTPTSTATFTAGQSFYIDLGSPKNVSSIYFLLKDGSYNLSVSSGSPESWQVTTSGATFSDYYKWKDAGVYKTTQYIKVDFESSNANPIIAEVAVSDTSNQQIKATSVTDLGPANPNLQNLIDEQDKIHMPFTYMSETYFDEIYFVRTAEQYWHFQSPFEWTHPPLGKLVQLSGIVMFGFSPFGWRIMGVIFGTLMIPVIYLLGKKLLGTWIGAFSAGFLLTFDFLHFTMARMGTADTYVVFFSLLSQLFFMVYFFKVVKEGWRTSVTPLFFAVIFFFLGFSTKWLVLYGAVGMLFLLAIIRIKELTKIKESITRKYVDFFNYPFNLLAGFIVLGIGIYFLIYIPDMLTGRSFFGINGVIDLQFHMYGYHSTLVATHAFASAWWSWPFLVSPQGYVPLWLAISYLPNNIDSTISAMGNPAVWWVGFAAMIVVTERAIRGKEFALALKNRLRKPKNPEPPIVDLTATSTSPDLGSDQTASTLPINPQPAEVQPKAPGRRWDLAAIFIAVIFFFSWIPYIFISRVTFIYHFYVSVPFLCLSSAYLINKYWNTRTGKIVTIIFFAAVVAMFVAFYPVISGEPTSTSWLHNLKWFPSWYFAP